MTFLKYLPAGLVVYTVDGGDASTCVMYIPGGYLWFAEERE